mgnify:CR=1 FL=1
MKKLNYESVLSRINGLYANAKAQKHPNIAELYLPKEVQSDQIKSVIRVFVDELNAIIEEANKRKTSRN